MPKFGLNDEDDVVIESDDAYQHISNVLAGWGEEGEETAKRAREASANSMRKKSVFSRAGFVRPIIGSRGSLGSPNRGDNPSSLAKFQKAADGGVGGEGVLVPMAANFSSLGRGSVDEVELSCCIFNHDALNNLLGAAGSSSAEDDIASNADYFRSLATSANSIGTDDGGMERNVWSLMEKLCSEGVDNLLRVRPDEYDDSAPLDVIISDVDNSPFEILGNISDNDRLLRRRQVVLDWLESCSEEKIVFHDPSTSRQKSQMWPKTLGKNGKNFNIDLNNLVGTDEEDETSLLHSVFMMIRAGKIQDACELCTKAGQPWRAASISGGNLMHELVDGQGKASFAGNPKFALWRRTCWKLGRKSAAFSGKRGNKNNANGHLDKSSYEAAIYSALGNDFDTLVKSPVLRDFNDYLWAHFRCMNERSIDECATLHAKKRREVGVRYPYAGDGAGADSGGARAEGEQLEATGGIANVDERYVVDSLGKLKESRLLWNKAICALILAEGEVSNFVSNDLMAGADAGSLR